MCFCLTVFSQRDDTELHKVFYAGVGWSDRCSIHQGGGGVWPGGAGPPKGYQGAHHEGAGQRGGHSTLAGEPRDERRL